MFFNQINLLKFQLMFNYTSKFYFPLTCNRVFTVHMKKNITAPQEQLNVKLLLNILVSNDSWLNHKT